MRFGEFLGGGFDSSAVVSLMAGMIAGPVKTCTIGFEDSRYNEAIYAKEFSLQYHTEHHEYYVKEDVAAIIKKLVWHFDEPFADSSMVPTYHVSRVAKKVVTVALSGDGGDESFGGYNKYNIDQVENRVRHLVPQFLLNMLSNIFNNYERGIGKKLYSLASSASLSPAEAFYVTNTIFSDLVLKEIVSDKLKKETNGYSSLDHTSRYYNKPNGLDHLSKILYTDLKTLLSGDIILKVYRMSMANSLEVRTTLLDHKVIEYTAKIPSTLKIKGKNKKFILKKAFEKILPLELMNRRKRGFDVPYNSWFREGLQQMAYNYLFKKNYMNEFFNILPVKIMWNKHQDRKTNYGILLWPLFMFSLWHEEFIGE